MEKDRNHKFFIPFPGFFKSENHNFCTYLGNISTFYKGKPMFIDIIFTKSKTLEEIKEDAKKAIETPGMVKSVVLSEQKIYERLKKGKPSSHNSMPKLVFSKGEPDFKFLEDDLLEIYVDKDDRQSLDCFKILFFPAITDEDI